MREKERTIYIYIYVFQFFEKLSISNNMMWFTNAHDMKSLDFLNI